MLFCSQYSIRFVFQVMHRSSMKGINYFLAQLMSRNIFNGLQCHSFSQISQKLEGKQIVWLQLSKLWTVVCAIQN